MFRRAEAEFELHNREVLAAIQKRLQGHEQILLSGAALFDADHFTQRRRTVAHRQLVEPANCAYAGCMVQGVG